MNKVLSRAPLFWVLLPLAAGNLLAIMLIKKNALFGVILLPFIIGASLFLISKLKSFSHYKWRWIAGTGLALMIFAAGITDTFLHKTNLNRDFFANTMQPHDELLVRISEPLKQKDKIFKATAKIRATGSPSSM